jgi:hypothetical protein
VTSSLRVTLAALVSARSPLLLISGGACLLAGMYLLAGVAYALLLLGVLLIAAEWLVP